MEKSKINGVPEEKAQYTLIVKRDSMTLCVDTGSCNKSDGESSESREFGRREHD
jgi:hypothetical protein